jgi:SAM-dependent methyltransferase
MPVSINHVSLAIFNGWKDNTIPAAQHRLVSQEIKDLYDGRVIMPYYVLAEAVRMTGKETGEIIEVGCASGYYYEILRHLLGHAIAYRGIDYSEAMIAEAKLKYPGIPFEVGDAMRLPLTDGCCDILILECVLLHVPDFRIAIAESVSMSRKWVIFHRTPIVQGVRVTIKRKHTAFDVWNKDLLCAIGLILLTAKIRYTKRIYLRKLNTKNNDAANLEAWAYQGHTYLLICAYSIIRRCAL